MKTLCHIFSAIAVVLASVMCFVVGYNYRDMLCGIEHCGYSAPAYVALLAATPFAVVIAACIVLAVLFYKKSK